MLRAAASFNGRRGPIFASTDSTAVDARRLLTEPYFAGSIFVASI
jgi:hypothetical protein